MAKLLFLGRKIFRMLRMTGYSQRNGSLDTDAVPGKYL